MNLFCIICTTGQAWLRSQGTSCRPCRHQPAVPALKMIFYLLHVDAVWQHPSFVIVGSKPQLLFPMHFTMHFTLPFILIPLLVAVSSRPSSASLYCSQFTLFWRFKVPF